MTREPYEPNARDLIIHRARIGEITPAEAEAAAEQGGFGPLATRPSPIDFDPAKMPYWSLPMAVAWIAWRHIQPVRESCAEYRENWLVWFPGSWNVPTDDGQVFKRIDGHELKSLRRPTVVRLGFTDLYLTSTETLPPTCQMTVAEAEKQLLAALGAGQVVAVAKDQTGKVVEIPQREWPYLHLFEEQESDVLKYDALDARPAFTDVKLKRDDLQQLWQEFLVQPYMIEPMARIGTAGYVPFCAALHWIMTAGGATSRNLEDFEAWDDCVKKILPLIATGEVQIVGRPASGGPAQTIASETFAGVLVSHALRDEMISVIIGDDPWISCTPYVDEQHWTSDFNDKLYLTRYGSAGWTHLQVKKADVLREIKFDAKEKRPPIYTSGAPGRPTSMNLVRLEFEARCRRGDAEPSITLEAAALAKWLSRTHPEATPVKAKTIRNQLASDFRKRNAQK